MNNGTKKVTIGRVILYFSLLIMMLVILLFSGCNKKVKIQPYTSEGQKDPQNLVQAKDNVSANPKPTESEALSSKVLSLINEEGLTMVTRFNPPAGFNRIPSEKKELAGFLRGLRLKKSGSKVLLYDGSPKDNQEGHAAVFDLDIGTKNLQQCADSIMRIYAEYYWSIGDYDKIAFHLTNGFLMNYTKWRVGYRIVVQGNNVSWSKKATYDKSYKGFRNYLDTVFTYAGTLSLSKECKAINLDKILPGDMFLQGGSPGHCVLVVDIAEDKNGNRCFLLAQGYMPAQDFHILKNPLHPDDPWYYTTEITYPFRTPQWTFKKNSLVRWGEFPINKAGAMAD